MGVVVGVVVIAVVVIYFVLWLNKNWKGIPDAFYMIFFLYSGDICGEPFSPRSVSKNKVAVQLANNNTGKGSGRGGGRPDLRGACATQTRDTHTPCRAEYINIRKHKTQPEFDSLK